MRGAIYTFETKRQANVKSGSSTCTAVRLYDGELNHDIHTPFGIFSFASSCSLSVLDIFRVCDQRS